MWHKQSKPRDCFWQHPEVMQHPALNPRAATTGANPSKHARTNEHTGQHTHTRRRHTVLSNSIPHPRSYPLPALATLVHKPCRTIVGTPVVPQPKRTGLNQRNKPSQPQRLRKQPHRLPACEACHTPNASHPGRRSCSCRPPTQNPSPKPTRVTQHAATHKKPMLLPYPPTPLGARAYDLATVTT